MVLIEMRESVMNNMIDEIEEAKKSLHKTKSALCNIEDLVDEMYRAQEEYPEDVDMPEDEDRYTGEIEVSYQNRRNMRNMRDNEKMWHNYRMHRRNRRGYGIYSY